MDVQQKVPGSPDNTPSIPTPPQSTSDGKNRVETSSHFDIQSEAAASFSFSRPAQPVGPSTFLAPAVKPPDSSSPPDPPIPDSTTRSSDSSTSTIRPQFVFGPAARPTQPSSSARPGHPSLLSRLNFFDPSSSMHASKSRRPGLLAGAGPPVRQLSPGDPNAVSSGSRGRAYTPPLRPSASSTARPTANPPRAQVASKRIAGYGSGVEGGGGRQGDELRRREQESGEDERTQARDQPTASGPSRRKSGGGVPHDYLGLDKDFQAARDLIDQSASAEHEVVRPSARHLPPPNEVNEGGDSQAPEHDMEVDPVEEDEELDDDYRTVRLESPLPSSINPPPLPARPHKSRPPKVPAEVTRPLGPYHQTVSAEEEVGRRPSREVSAGGEPGGQPRQVDSSRTRRQGSRNDAVQRDKGEGSSKDDLTELMHLALGKASQKDETIRTLRSEVAILKDQQRESRRLAKEFRAKSQSLETLLETVQQDHRSARDHFTKSHSHLLDEVLDLKGHIGEHRGRLESYFDPNDNWFEGMKDKIQEAVGPLQGSLETAKERVQFSTETITYLKNELSLKAGDLAERIARITELESRDVSKVEALRAKDAALEDSRALIQSRQQEIEGLKQEMQGLKTSLNTAELAAQELRKQVETKHADYLAAVKAQQDAALQLGDVREKLEDSKGVLAEEQRARTKVRTELDNAQASIVAASNRSDVLSDEKIKLTSDHQQSLADLRRCQEELSTSRSTAESRSQELQRLRLELQEARTSSEQMAERDSKQNAAEIELLQLRNRELESSLATARRDLEESQTRLSSVRSQLEDDQASRGEQVAQLQGQLASQEKALKEEMRLSTIELAELREKHKQISSSSEECAQLRALVQNLQDQVSTTSAELLDVKTKAGALSDQVSELTDKKNSLADRYKINALSSSEQALVKIIKKGIEASTQREQMELENKLKRAYKAVESLKKENEEMQRKLNKQLARTGSGKARDLINSNADKSSTPSSAHEGQRGGAEDSRILVVDSRSNSANGDEGSGPGRLAALDEDEDEVDDSLPQAEGSPPKSKRPAPTTVSNDGQVATKKLRSSTTETASSNTRPGVGGSKTYKKTNSSRRNK